MKCTEKLCSFASINLKLEFLILIMICAKEHREYTISLNLLIMVYGKQVWRTFQNKKYVQLAQLQHTLLMLNPSRLTASMLTASHAFFGKFQNAIDLDWNVLRVFYIFRYIFNFLELNPFSESCRDIFMSPKYVGFSCPNLYLRFSQNFWKNEDIFQGLKYYQVLTVFWTKKMKSAWNPLLDFNHGREVSSHCIQIRRKPWIER